MSRHRRVPLTLSPGSASHHALESTPTIPRRCCEFENYHTVSPTPLLWYYHPQYYPHLHHPQCWGWCGGDAGRTEAAFVLSSAAGPPYPPCLGLDPGDCRCVSRPVPASCHGRRPPLNHRPGYRHCDSHCPLLRTLQNPRPLPLPLPPRPLPLAHLRLCHPLHWTYPPWSDPCHHHHHRLHHSRGECRHVHVHVVAAMTAVLERAEGGRDMNHHCRPRHYENPPPGRFSSTKGCLVDAGSSPNRRTLIG